MTVHTGVRGIRDTLPPGVVLGRIAGTPGTAQMFDFTTLGKAIAAAVPAGTGFGQIGNNLIVANISGASNTPIGVAASALLDATLGSVQGDILYRNATVWTVLTPGTSGKFLQTLGAGTNPLWASGNAGTVTSVSVTTANGVSGTVATATTTPAITLSLGAITPTTVTASSTVQGTQLISTVATGTAPFTVASTTNVANLNASSLSGATFASPGAIGSGTPGSGSFTTGDFSGEIDKTNTAATQSKFMNVSGSTTAATYGSITNTTGGLLWGVDSSAGGILITGDTAYDAALSGKTGLAFSANNGTTLHMRIASTGAVTLSSTLTTADPGLGAGAWKLGQVESGLGLALNTTSYVQIMVDGAAVKLAQVL